MEITICKWKRDVASPVLFFIDELSNTWIDRNANGIADPGEDFGYMGEGRNSSMSFLKDEILAGFPEVKVTLFVSVAGDPNITHDDCQVRYSNDVCEDGVAAAFFRRLAGKERFEAAYNGKSCFREGGDRKRRVKGWEKHVGLKETEFRLNRDAAAFRDILGRYPEGVSGFGDANAEKFTNLLAERGFKWRGEDLSPKRGKSFDVSCTAEGLYNIPVTLKTGSRHGMLRRLRYLLENKFVISIQEGIAPAGEKGRKGSPDIFADRDSIRRLFECLKDKPVWYCTAGELTQYCRIRDNIRISYNGSRFSFNYSQLSAKKIIKPKTGADEIIPANEITIKLSERLTAIILPDGTNVSSDENGSFTVPVLDGQYGVKFIKKSIKNDR